MLQQNAGIFHSSDQQSLERPGGSESKRLKPQKISNFERGSEAKSTPLIQNRLG